MNMETVTLKTAPEVKRVVCAAFPGYKKHKAFLSSFHPTRINSYWDGGSKDEYAIVDLSTMRRAQMPTSTHPYFDVVSAGLASKSDDLIEVDHVGNVTLKILPVGFALVRSGTFCGKPATAHVYVNAENLTKFIGCAV